MRVFGGVVRSSAAVAVLSVVVLSTTWTAPQNAPAAVSGQLPDPSVARRDPTAASSDLVADALDLAQAPTSSVVPTSAAAARTPASEPVDLDTFLVGDSSFVEAAAVTGAGSAFSGHGYTDEAALGVQNPLLAPAEDYEGPVVLGVSLWDASAKDLSGYRQATDRYRSLGYDVVWIEVPPAGVRYDGRPLDPRLERLNDAVANHLGCDLQPWRLRDVETFGSATGDRVNGDWVHPTPAGGRQIAENAAKLTAADACEPRQPDPGPTAERGTCAVVVYTPPSAAAARKGELCVPAGPATTTVILVHGGGGYEGNRAQADPWRDAHLAAGRATFSIDYALLDPTTADDGPVWPLPEQNLKAAVQFVRADDTLPNASIVVHGFSAGARLAAIAATTGGDPRFTGAELWPDTSDAVDAAVLFYGYYDGSQFHPDRYYGPDDPAVGAAIGQVDPADAPLLLVHGTADGLIPPDHSETLAAAATAAGATAELILVDGGGHGFDGYGTDALTDAGRALFDDIDAHLAV